MKINHAFHFLLQLLINMLYACVINNILNLDYAQTYKQINYF